MAARTKRKRSPPPHVQKAEEPSRAALASSNASLRELFVSYAWNDESQALVDRLESALSEHDIRLIRDRNEVGYKDGITDVLSDMNALSPRQHEGTGFEELLRRIHAPTAPTRAQDERSRWTSTTVRDGGTMVGEVGTAWAMALS